MPAPPPSAVSTLSESHTPPRVDAQSYPARRIYSVVGVPPEVQAYALAKYSRSSQGMLESIQELSAQRAEQFLETFYFQYGHRSIADLAHLVFGLEQISILAAVAVVDEPVWDGQERSTRYQPFRKTGWHLPQEVSATPVEPIFAQTAEGLFAAYAGLSAALLEYLIDAVPRPAELPEQAYRRTLRARAFDVARSLLPMATHTSVGQIVSARVLEGQIGRLLGSPYAELRAVGAELKASCQAPAMAPLSSEPQPAAAPTLVKYADASVYQARVARELTQAAESLLAYPGEADRGSLVELAEPSGDPLREMVATLLYRFDQAGHSYRQIQALVADLDEARVQEVFAISLDGRGLHEDVLREHRAGYALTFDTLVDLGSFRDLHRHRRCVQIQQPLTWSHGFIAPEEVFEMGLGGQAASAALDGGLGETYTEALAKAERAAASVRQVAAPAADYLLPLAYRTRCLFKMDWAEAAYVIEQRTQPQGHFSYRNVAWGMYTTLRARYPHLAAPIRATDPNGPMDLLRR
ncbi:MAG: FAD-dependent thymidylate synthase [Chloroflexota bacterium]|nr:FAD-dependent thymidylate synthase [Chloroflexota bacterium]